MVQRRIIPPPFWGCFSNTTIPDSALRILTRISKPTNSQLPILLVIPFSSVVIRPERVLLEFFIRNLVTLARFAGIYQGNPGLQVGMLTAPMGDPSSSPFFKRPKALALA